MPSVAHNIQLQFQLQPPIDAFFAMLLALCAIRSIDVCTSPCELHYVDDFTSCICSTVWQLALTCAFISIYLSVATTVSAYVYFAMLLGVTYNSVCVDALVICRMFNFENFNMFTLLFCQFTHWSLFFITFSSFQYFQRCMLQFCKWHPWITVSKHYMTLTCLPINCSALVFTAINALKCICL